MNPIGPRFPQEISPFFCPFDPFQSNHISIITRKLIEKAKTGREAEGKAAEGVDFRVKHFVKIAAAAAANIISETQRPAQLSAVNVGSILGELVKCEVTLSKNN